ncbi:11426_t:CDS:2 [Paraglomus brasilianum]|uniref:11426_t:CDS:1 n=1 Tax=Paraglomus brasilianum TaxID=144538 RepID=A0A9N9DUL3_9GLOM|nr:11426_t:CDS:2 [Paraglomus brasilianum]
MTKGTELTDFERGFIISASSFGVTKEEVGEKLGRSRNTVHTVIAKYKENRATTVAKRSGRPCILTERDERQLKRIVKSDCKQPLSVIRENLAESVKHGGGGVMVWACFTWNELGPLIRLEGKINSQRYVEEVL